MRDSNNPILDISVRGETPAAPAGSMVITFRITTLGCKVNQYEGHAIAATLARAGLSRVASSRQPVDLVVIHTCCVTRTAMSKSRQAIRRQVRTSPEASVLVSGCYGDYDAQHVRSVLQSVGVPPERQYIVGHHGDLADCLSRLATSLADTRRQQPRDPRTDAGRYDVRMKASESSSNHPNVPLDPSTSIIASRRRAVKGHAPGTRDLATLERFAGHQRAFVKVQDGCDAMCSYCIVCYTRPNVWSRPREDVLAECRQLVAAGHREIVLSGIFLGAYGRDTANRVRWPEGPQPLAELLRSVASIEGLWRVRLSSLEPGDVTDELIDVCRALPAVAPHLHLPLQSGSPDVLKRMNRQYTPDEFRSAVDRLRSALDRPALSADVIVGFPGETDRDFQETLNVARHAGFAKIHAFPFSPIEGTQAWRHRKDQPPREVVRQRMARLAELEAELASSFRGQLVGEVHEALVESTRPAEGVRQGMTDRYQLVEFPAAGDDLIGSVVNVHIEGVTDTGLRGRLVNGS